MASFHAVLILGSPEQSGSRALPSYPVDICSQHMQQEVDRWGHVLTQTHPGELHLTLPPPPDVQLVAWAKNQHEGRTCSVVFREINGASPSLVLTLENAYCVSYAEHFQTDHNGHVSYFCQLSIAASRITKHGTAFTASWHPG